MKEKGKKERERKRMREKGKRKQGEKNERKKERYQEICISMRDKFTKLHPGICFVRLAHSRLASSPHSFPFFYETNKI